MPLPDRGRGRIRLAKRVSGRGASNQWKTTVADRGIRGRMGVSGEPKRKEGVFPETIRVIFHALIIAVVIRTFLFQPFNIPSGSMEATLLVGDYLFVSKYAYGYSHYSLPFSPPVFSGRMLARQPERGDVVVFRLPKDDSVDYIKRVIGLAGDPTP